MDRYSRKYFTQAESGDSWNALPALLAQARFARMGRSMAHAEASSSAAAMLEHQLTAPMPPRMGLSPYLNRVLTLQQMASPSMPVVMSAVERLSVRSLAARSLAVALIDQLHFATAVMDVEDRAAFFLAVAHSDGRLVFGFAVTGDFKAVGTKAGTDSLVRAAAIVRASGGQFQRGFDSGRMVFASTFEDRAFRSGLGGRREKGHRQ